MEEVSTTQATIRFNVGGKHYEVARSLIERLEDSMLSRLVSETWQKDQGAIIFIDRDGEQFRHVLNYLRHGRVSLPINVSKTDFLRDMDYYGISIGEGTVEDASANVLAAGVIAKLEREANNDVESIDREIGELQTKKSLLLFARECHREYAKTGSTHLNFKYRDVDENVKEGFGKLNWKCNWTYFNSCLARYGFQLKERRDPHNYAVYDARLVVVLEHLGNSNNE